MAHDNKDTISTLNGLIETCEDGVKGFRTAAEAVENSEAKALFLARVTTIEKAAAQLKTEVRRMGGDAEKGGSVAGAVHRGWIDLKAAITGKDEAAIVAECERGEDVAVKHYESALKKELPPDVRKMVESQYQGVLKNRELVRRLNASVAS